MADDLEEDEDVWDEKSLKQLKRRLKGPQNGTTSKQKKAPRQSNPRASTAKPKSASQAKPPSEDVSQQSPCMAGATAAGTEERIVRSSAQATPVSRGCPSPLRFCPSCQLPFSKFTIGARSPRWHVAECLEDKSSPVGDCPEGTQCTFQTPSHFRRFSHKLLARVRSNSSRFNKVHEDSIECSSESQEKPSWSRELKFSSNCETLSGTESVEAPGSAPIDFTEMEMEMDEQQSLCPTMSTAASTDHSKKYENENQSSGMCTGDFTEDLKPLLATENNRTTCNNDEINSKEIPMPKQTNGILNEHFIKEEVMSENGATFFENDGHGREKASPHKSDDDDAYLKAQQEFTHWSNSNSTCNVVPSEESQSLLENINEKYAASDYRPMPDSRQWKFEKQSSTSDGLQNSERVIGSPTSKSSFEFGLQIKQEKRFPAKTCQAGCSIPIGNPNQPKKPLVQQDIGVFFGQKPLNRPAVSKTSRAQENSSQNGTQKAGPYKQLASYRKQHGADISDGSSGGGEESRGPRSRQRSCPFYKKISGTEITVDAFRYGKIPHCSAYFLTHFHYDHYAGLGKKFDYGPIYCSKITANLVTSKLGVNKSHIHPLPNNTAVMVNDVEVTLLDANHCPGSVLFLFRLRNGKTILHTGDFRASEAMECYTELKSTHVNILYLDTTYCNPEYTFPPQEDTIRFAVTKAREVTHRNPKALIVSGTYTIGKEKVFLAIAEALGYKATVSSEKKRVLECMESDAINSIITRDKKVGRVHVLRMQDLNHKFLAPYVEALKPHFTEVLAFKPTGWEHSNKVQCLSAIKPSNRGAVTIYGIPYSEHSSFKELERFVKFVRPDKIIPTVNNGSADARTKMDTIFKQWLAT